jgi:hypothetical protein
MTPLILQCRVIVAQAVHQTVPLFCRNEALLVHIRHILQHLLLHVHYFDHLYQLSSFCRFQMQINLVKLLVLTSRHVFKLKPFVGLVSTCLMHSLNLHATYTLPTPAGAGHQWTESTNIGCNQWLLLAKIALKVPPAGRNCSLVANTSRCGEGISQFLIAFLLPLHC